MKSTEKFEITQVDNGEWCCAHSYPENSICGSGFARYTYAKTPAEALKLEIVNGWYNPFMEAQNEQ